MTGKFNAWPFAIAGVLGVFVIANFAMYRAAGEPHASAVEPDYYQKAVAWDSTMAAQARSEQLGWRIEARLGARGRDGTSLHVRVTDRAGAPVIPDRANVVAIHNAIADEPVSAALTPDAMGVLFATLPLSRSGLWELRLSIARGSERFTTSQRVDAASTP